MSRHAAALALAVLLPAAGVQAQQAGGIEQRTERITVEDGRNRVDELRVGGQTRSITVQPKSGAPAYEVDPGNLARSRPAEGRDGQAGAGGQRSWSVLRF